MRILHIALVGLLAAAPAMALLAPASAHAEEDEAKLKKRLEKLEKENAELRDELAKAQAETRKLFDDATRAEKNARLVFRTATAVASEKAPAGVPPVGTAATRHGIARLDHAELELSIVFKDGRNLGGWRVHSTSCVMKNKRR